MQQEILVCLGSLIIKDLRNIMEIKERQRESSVIVDSQIGRNGG